MLAQWCSLASVGLGCGNDFADSRVLFLATVQGTYGVSAFYVSLYVGSGTVFRQSDSTVRTVQCRTVLTCWRFRQILLPTFLHEVCIWRQLDGPTKMTVLVGFSAGLRHFGATLVLLFVLLSASSRPGIGLVQGFPRTPFSPTTTSPNAAMPFHGRSTSRIGNGSRLPAHAARRRRNHHQYDEDDDEEDDASTQVSTSGIPQLPAFQSHKTGPAAPAALPQQPMVASRQFQLQYTCKLCETRNQHTVSRIAYRQGVVIARCKGCDTQHLIADHLGFTGGFPRSSDISSNNNNNNNETRTATIEEHFADGVVNRVSKEVFDLERVLQGHDAKSGSIMGENGELAME